MIWPLTFTTIRILIPLTLRVIFIPLNIIIKKSTNNERKNNVSKIALAIYIRTISQSVKNLILIYQSFDLDSYCTSCLSIFYYLFVICNIFICLPIIIYMLLFLMNYQQLISIIHCLHFLDDFLFVSFTEIHLL